MSVPAHVAEPAIRRRGSSRPQTRDSADALRGHVPVKTAWRHQRVVVVVRVGDQKQLPVAHATHPPPFVHERDADDGRPGSRKAGWYDASVASAASSATSSRSGEGDEGTSDGGSGGSDGSTAVRTAVPRRERVDAWSVWFFRKLERHRARSAPRRVERVRRGRHGLHQAHLRHSSASSLARAVAHAVQVARPSPRTSPRLRVVAGGDDLLRRAIGGGGSAPGQAPSPMDDATRLRIARGRKKPHRARGTARRPDRTGDSLPAPRV